MTGDDPRAVAIRVPRRDRDDGALRVVVPVEGSLRPVDGEWCIDVFDTEDGGVRTLAMKDIQLWSSAVAAGATRSPSHGENSGPEA